tara:strand:+ start:947 stop:1153 length:207 start_codon:yes stop_codon:yes gene_type:complete
LAKEKEYERRNAMSEEEKIETRMISMNMTITSENEDEAVKMLQESLKEWSEMDAKDLLESAYFNFEKK